MKDALGAGTKLDNTFVRNTAPATITRALDQQKYISPVGDNEFPILASTAMYYKGLTKTKFKFTFDFDMVRRCGFNIIDSHMSFGDIDNAYINKKAEDAGLAIEAGETWYYRLGDIDDPLRRVRNYVEACGGLSAVSAWKFKDEPLAEDFDRLIITYEYLKWASNKMIVTNLLAGFDFSSFKGLSEGKTIDETYYAKDYVNRFEEMFKPGVWSYDAYPIKQNAYGIYMDHGSFMGFYGNLIFYACRTYDHEVNGVTYEGRPFWAYVESMEMKVFNPNNVLACRFPKAIESFMRYEAFSALAFGAQGILYWTYGDREANSYEVYYGALMDMDGNPNDAWYYAQKVNREIHALKDVFLGCKLVEFWFSKRNDTELGFSNADAVKFLYGGYVKNALDTSTIYVGEIGDQLDFKGEVGIVTTKIMKDVVNVDGHSVISYYKIFLNQDFQHPIQVNFTVVSLGIYRILPDTELAARKFETKEDMKMEIKPIRIPILKGVPLQLTIPAGGYLIFEVPN